MLLDVCQLTRGVTDDQSFMLANSLQDQHNFSRHTNSIIVWIFIQNISKFLTCLPPCRPFSKLLSISRHDSVSGHKQIFCLADTPQRVDNICRATCFAYSCISFVQLFQLHFFVHYCQESYCPSSLVSNQMYNSIDGMLATSSK